MGQLGATSQHFLDPTLGQTDKYPSVREIPLQTGLWCAG